MLASANLALREKKYVEAIGLYLSLSRSKALFNNIVVKNIAISNRFNIKSLDNKKLMDAVFECNESSKQRASFFVKELLDQEIKIEHIAESITKENEFKNHFNYSLVNFKFNNPSISINEFFSFVRDHPYNRIFIIHPNYSGIMLGLAYKLIWGSKVVLDLLDDSLIDASDLQCFDFFSSNSSFQKNSCQVQKVLDRSDFHFFPKNGNHALNILETENIIKFFDRYQLLKIQEHPIIGSINSDLKTQKNPEKEKASQALWIHSLGYKNLDTLSTVEILFNSDSNQNFIKNLFNIALGRPPGTIEFNHYEHLLNSKESNFLDLAKIVFGGEESKRYFRDLNSTSATYVKNDFVLPKIGDIDPAQLFFPAPEQNPTVSIVIPVYEKLEFTLACLKSILDHLPKVSFEVLVLDDQSPDESYLELAKISNIRVIRNPQNLGFLKSCNSGSDHARGRFIFLLNNDTKVTEDWLDKSVEVFSQFKDIGMVGSKLIYPDGSLQEAGGIVWNDGSAWNFGRDCDPLLPEFNYIREVDYCSGAAILIERDLFDKLGRFDERYIPAYYEDNDLAFKVREFGKKVIYQPRSAVIHFEGVSHGTDELSGLKAYQVANSKKFFNRWASVLMKNHYKNGEKVFLAKDRAFNKKTVLIIDHYVPQPDRDAGSKSMWHIINTLVKNNFNVKFWPHNNYYDPVYSPWLENIGVEVIAGDHTVNQFKTWLIKHGYALDQVMLSRPHISVDFVDLLKQYSKAKLIYYGHDIHYLRLENQYKVTKKSQILEEVKLHKRLEEWLWGNITTIYYPSIEEEVYVNNWLDKSLIKNVICRTIPVYAYESFENEFSADFDIRADIIFVAGFGHPPNIDAAKWFVKEIFSKVLIKHPDLILTLVGSNPSDEVKSLASKNVKVTGFVSDSELQRIYQKSKLSVVPLLYGGGMKGKVIESMRFGLPLITTPTGLQGLDNASEFIPSTDDPGKFSELISSYLDDKDKWISTSKAMIKFVKDHYSSEALWRIIKDDFI